MNANDKIVRMAGLVRCDEIVLRTTTDAYIAARKARRSAKRSHDAATIAAAALLGSHEGAWDYATWAQNLVDVQLVSL